jgi:hypothetical protein
MRTIFEWNFWNFGCGARAWFVGLDRVRRRWMERTSLNHA